MPAFPGFFARLTVCLLLPLVAGCNWQLRGVSHLALPEATRTVYVTGEPTPLLHALQQSIRDSRGELAESPATADLTLQVLREHSQRRTATISASARVSEHLLSHEVEYVILDAAGAAVFPPGRFEVERVYEYNEDNVLATDDETVLLQREMQRDLVRQLHMRLAQAAHHLVDANATAP